MVSDVLQPNSKIKKKEKEYKEPEGKEKIETKWKGLFAAVSWIVMSPIFSCTLLQDVKGTCFNLLSNKI